MTVRESLESMWSSDLGIWWHKNCVGEELRRGFSKMALFGKHEDCRLNPRNLHKKLFMPITPAFRGRNRRIREHVDQLAWMGCRVSGLVRDSVSRQKAENH